MLAHLSSRSMLGCALVVSCLALVACDLGGKKKDDAPPAASAAAATASTVAAATTSAPPAATSAAPAVAAAKPAGVPGRWPFTSTRLMQEQDWGAGAGLSCHDAMLMRNEIYARHGYIFKTKSLADYFAQQPWYKPENANVDNMLTGIERQNVESIKAYEKNVCPS